MFGARRVELATDLTGMPLRLGDAVDQSGGQRNKGREEPEPPPQRARVTLHHLVAAEAAVAVERTGDSAAAPALVELEAAMSAARLVGAVDDHRRLVAPRTKAGSNERQRWKLHISVMTGITIGRRLV